MGGILGYMLPTSAILASRNSYLLDLLLERRSFISSYENKKRVSATSDLWRLWSCKFYERLTSFLGSVHPGKPRHCGRARGIGTNNGLGVARSKSDCRFDNQKEGDTVLGHFTRRGSECLLLIITDVRAAFFVYFVY